MRYLEFNDSEVIGELKIRTKNAAISVIVSIMEEFDIKTEEVYRLE